MTLYLYFKWPNLPLRFPIATEYNLYRLPFYTKQYRKHNRTHKERQ